MTLVMYNVPLGQCRYDTCYGQCATGAESLCHFLCTVCHWDRVVMSLVMHNVPLGIVIMTLVMDNVPLGQIRYDTCYGQCATGTESL